MIESPSDAFESIVKRCGDGNVRRLRRGQDFEAHPQAFRKLILKQARVAQRPVHVVMDKTAPDKYVWIQVGDAAIDIGEPCVCGSTDIVRLHKFWARCRACRRLLELRPAVSGDVGDGAHALSDGAALDAYASVALYRYQLNPDEEWCYGTADHGDGVSRLIAVVFPLDDGGRIADPKQPGRWQYTAHEIEDRHVLPLLDAADLERGPEVSWLVDEDQGPDPSDLATLE